MKSTKIPPSASAIRKELGWTCQQLNEVLGVQINSLTSVPYLERLARVAPYFKMYRSNPDWNL